LSLFDHLPLALRFEQRALLLHHLSEHADAREAAAHVPLQRDRGSVTEGGKALLLRPAAALLGLPRGPLLRCAPLRLFALALRPLARLLLGSFLQQPLAVLVDVLREEDLAALVPATVALQAWEGR
jgi:hypothetical protein